MTDSAPHYLLDSFAVLTLLGKEEGFTRIQQVLGLAQQKLAQVTLSVINLGEVLYITERRHGLAKTQAILAAIEQLPIEILPATQKRVLAAAHVKANYPVAYADAFAIAAAQELEATALTNAPEFRAVEAIIRVEWLSAKSSDEA